MQALKHFTLEGQIVDVVNQRIISGVIEVEDGRIKRIKERAVNESHYILPGFVDAHVHIESSMLVPSEFARVAVTHGTIAVVSDPHEIANVLGVEGVKFMIENSSISMLQVKKLEKYFKDADQVASSRRKRKNKNYIRVFFCSFCVKTIEAVYWII